MREAVHRPFVEEDEDDELDGRDGKREGEAALARREKGKRHEQHEAYGENGDGNGPVEGLALVAGAVGLRNEEREPDGGSCTGACAREPAPDAEPGGGRVVGREDGAERQDAGRGEEQGDPGVFRGLETRRELRVRPCAG